MDTIRGIVDEIRRLNDDGFPLDGESSHPLVEDMRLLADRIEEAYDFELAVEKARAAGEGYAAGKQSVKSCNQFKMREAVKATMKLIESAIVDGKVTVDSLAALQNIVSRALSAPQRNCDMFSDEIEAQLKFLNDVWLVSTDRESMLERLRIENWTEEMLLRYARWLLAPVKKEENDE